MHSSLRAQLDALADRFADQVLAAIRSASLEEVIVSKGRSARVVPPAKGGAKPSGRLPRRSVEEIGKALDKIVLLVKTRKEGMRAEDIRAAFGLRPNEMPRILQQGLATKKLTARGRKRATTYFAR